MNIFEKALKGNIDIRLTCGDNWLFWDEARLQWIVYQQKCGQEKTRVLIVTENEEWAIDRLLEDRYVLKEVETAESFPNIEKKCLK